MSAVLRPAVKRQLDGVQQRAVRSLRTYRNHRQVDDGAEDTTNSSLLKILKDVTLKGHKETESCALPF